MRKLVFAVVAALVAATPHLAAGQSPSDEAPSMIDITETTCRDLLRAGADEEEDILIYFHGFVSGARGETVVDVDVFRDVSEAIVDACIDAPSATLLDVFQSKR